MEEMEYRSVSGKSQMNLKRPGIGFGFIIFLVIVILLIVYSWLRFKQSYLSEPILDKLAYVTDQGIYLVNPDGSNQVFLGQSRGGSAFTHVRWSPDGTQIAYNVGDLMWGRAYLYVLNVDGTNLRFLTEVPPNASWGWSPDSQAIYISRHSHMGSTWYVLVQVETGQILCQDTYYSIAGRPACAPFELSGGGWWSGYGATVVKDDHRWALAPTVDSSVVYGAVISPNEEWVAFNAYNYTDSRYSWYVARSDGQELRLLYAIAASHTFCYDAVWSTDSQNLAFSTYDDGQVSLWITAPDDGSMLLLTRFEETGCPDRLKWSTDGQHIGFSIYGHRSRRYVVSVPGGKLTPMPPEGAFEVCEWSPDGKWLGCIDTQSIAVFRVADGRRFDVATVNWPGLERAGARLAWSSTGRWFATNAQTGLYTFDTVTHKVRQVTSQEVRGFAWSPSDSEEH